MTFVHFESIKENKMDQSYQPLLMGWETYISFSLHSKKGNQKISFNLYSFSYTGGKVYALHNQLVNITKQTLKSI